MSKITDILSKPVISLIDSKIEGIVKNAIFDRNFKRVKWLVLFDNNEHQEEKALNINDIYSLGQNAIMIKSEDNLSLEISCKKIDDKNLPINNSVYTHLGKFIGKVTDIEIDENYYIVSIFVGNKQILINDVICCGLDTVIIQDEEIKIDIKNFRRKNNKIKVQTLSKENDYKVEILNEQKIETNNETTKENNIIDLQIKEETIHPTLPKTLLANYEFLIGRKLEKNIYSQNNELIAKKNMKITNEIINKAKMYYKLRELTKYSR